MFVFLGWVSDSLFTPVCKTGDANGSPEQNTGQQFTREACYEAVLALGANAATTDASCPNECRCFAEFDADSRNSNGNFYGCILYPGE